MLPLMACTCALRAVEPIPHIRITRRKTLLARIVMAAPGTKLSFVKEVLESNVCAWLSGVLTANRNRVAKRCWFQKRQERGTKKVPSNELPRLLYVCEDSITAGSDVEQIKPSSFTV